MFNKKLVASTLIITTPMRFDWWWTNVAPQYRYIDTKGARQKQSNCIISCFVYNFVKYNFKNVSRPKTTHATVSYENRATLVQVNYGLTDNLRIYIVWSLCWLIFVFLCCVFVFICHCVVYPSSIYGFLLSHLYLQTLFSIYPAK